MLNDLILFHYPLSRSLRVLWLLNELNLKRDVDYKVVQMKLGLGEGYSPEYSKINPNHSVPAISWKENGGVQRSMYESGAIMRFLVANYANSLAPSPQNSTVKFDLADFECMYYFALTTMDSVLWNLRVVLDFLNLDPKTDANAKQIVEYAVTKFNTVIISQIEERLSKQPYMLKEGFSLVDIVIAQNLNWALKYRMHLKPYPEGIKKFMKRMKERPAFQKSTMDAADFEKDFNANSQNIILARI